MDWLISLGHLTATAFGAITAILLGTFIIRGARVRHARLSMRWHAKTKHPSASDVVLDYLGNLEEEEVHPR